MDNHSEAGYVNASQSLLEDAELALNNLSHQEVQLIKDTEELLKQQVNYMVNIDELRKHIPNMKSIKDDTKSLSNLVDSSYMLVEDVCGKFRRIDLAKSRLEDSLSKLGDILDLKTCRDGVMKSMEAENYEETAVHIKRFLSIDQVQLQKTLSIICDCKRLQHSRWPQSNIMTSNLDQPVKESHSSLLDESGTAIDPKLMNLALKELETAKSQLLKLCQDYMTKAIQENNVRDIERFFKIFPILGEHLDGLLRYSEYLKSKIITTQLDQTLNSKDIDRADKLSALFEAIAKLIDSHQPLIETYYGPGHLIIVIRVLQRECDRQSRKILEEFRNETNLQQVAKIVRQSTHLPIITHNPQSGPNNPQDTSGLNLTLNTALDPRNVDKILNEISMIISRSEVYLSFITKRVQDDIDSRAENELQKKTIRVELYNMINLECELNHLVQEVGGIYVMLEQFYLNESSKKAIMMDQIDFDPSNDSCLISSMLDDIFFIIKKCTKRALATRSNEVFCAIINHCVTLLEATFCQILEDRLRNQQYYTSFSAKNLDFSQAYNALQSGRYLQSVSDTKKSNAQYFSSLNNLEKACEYIRTLRNLLDEDVRKLKPSTIINEKQHDSQLEKSITCLNELSQLSSRFSSIVNSSLYQLFNISLRTRIKAGLNQVIDENPDLICVVTSSNRNEMTSLARSLLKTADSSLEGNLLQENYAKLIMITKDFLSSSINST